MKRQTLLILIPLLLLTMSAASRLSQLEKKRDGIKLQITRTKLKLIQDDEDLQDLHQRILRMHRKLADKLESHDDIKKLSTDLAKVEAEIKKAK